MITTELTNDNMYEGNNKSNRCGQTASKKRKMYAKGERDQVKGSDARASATSVLVRVIMVVVMVASFLCCCQAGGLVGHLEL